MECNNTGRRISCYINKLSLYSKTPSTSFKSFYMPLIVFCNTDAILARSKWSLLLCVAYFRCLQQVDESTLSTLLSSSNRNCFYSTFRMTIITDENKTNTTVKTQDNTKWKKKSKRKKHKKTPKQYWLLRQCFDKRECVAVVYRMKRLPGSSIDVIKHVASRLRHRLHTTQHDYSQHSVSYHYTFISDLITLTSCNRRVLLYQTELDSDSLSGYKQVTSLTTWHHS